MFDLNWNIVIIRDQIGTLKAPTDVLTQIASPVRLHNG